MKELVMGNLGTRKLEGIVLLEPGKTKAQPMLASTSGKEKYGTFSENKNISRANEKVILSGLLNLVLMCLCQRCRGRGINFDGPDTSALGVPPESRLSQTLLSSPRQRDNSMQRLLRYRTRCRWDLQGV